MAESKGTKITRVSLTLRILSWLGLLGTPSVVGIVWFAGSESLLLSGEATHFLIPHGASFESGRLDLPMRFNGFLISMIPGLVTMYGFLHLARLFERFARLEFFTVDTVRHFRIFATTVVAVGILMPLSGALLSLATSLGNSPGNTLISVTAGDSELATIFLGCVMLVIAYVMEQGKRLADDYQGIV